jgi:hypothetical protein
MYIGRWLESIPKLEELLKSTPYDPKAVLSLQDFARFASATAPAAGRAAAATSCNGSGPFGWQSVSACLAGIVRRSGHASRAADAVWHPCDGQLGIPKVHTATVRTASLQ